MNTREKKQSIFSKVAGFFKSKVEEQVDKRQDKKFDAAMKKAEDAGDRLKIIQTAVENGTIKTDSEAFRNFVLAETDMKVLNWLIKKDLYLYEIAGKTSPAEAQVSVARRLGALLHKGVDNEQYKTIADTADRLLSVGDKDAKMELACQGIGFAEHIKSDDPDIRRNALYGLLDRVNTNTTVRSQDGVFIVGDKDITYYAQGKADGDTNLAPHASFTFEQDKFSLPKKDLLFLERNEADARIEDSENALRKWTHDKTVSGEAKAYSDKFFGDGKPTLVVQPSFENINSKPFSLNDLYAMANSNGVHILVPDNTAKLINDDGYDKSWDGLVCDVYREAFEANVLTTEGQKNYTELSTEERIELAKRGKDEDLDILVKDADWGVRYAVARCERDKDLDVLMHDECKTVRRAVAECGRPQDYDTFINDESSAVQAAYLEAYEKNKENSEHNEERD